MDVDCYCGAFIHMKSITTIYVTRCGQLKLCHYQIVFRLVELQFGHFVFLNNENKLGAGSTHIVKDSSLVIDWNW